MSTGISKLVWVIGLMGASTAAFAADPKAEHPQEPVGLLAGGVIGAFAAGPVGAIVGAGLGTWLGNRVHRASDAAASEARSAALESDKNKLQLEKTRLLESNQDLSAKLEDLSQKVEKAQVAKQDESGILDGLQGDVLFRTGSAEITPDIAHQIQVLAQAVAKASSLKVRVDGYADPRGTDEVNMKLSLDRANAVRDLLLAAGVSDEALEINAYGKSQSVAADSDGYALERRVRLTLQVQSDAAVAQIGKNE
jgi:outer membrane protein OmpA-like peptidoglycan-associated protein